MHPLVKNTIKFFLFLAVSAFLFWLVYRDQNWDELLTVLKEDVNYFWIGVACVMGIASHVSRALRWQLLTASMGYRISFGNSFRIFRQFGYPADGRVYPLWGSQ